MNLDISNWEEFRVGDLFIIRRGDRIVHDEDYFDNQDEVYKYPVITTTTANNGIDGFYDQTNSDGNCIVSGGEASGMFTTYQEKPFWGLDTVRIYEPKGFRMNKFIGLFLATELTYNMYRFSYGRKAKPDNMYTLDIKLPVDSDGNPDWQFMEDYMKSLHYKPLTTKNKKGQTPDLNVQNWKEFVFDDIFELHGGFYNKKPEHSDYGNIPFLASTENNNGVTEFYCLEDIEQWDKVGGEDYTLDKKIYSGNCIAVTVNGSVCNAFYQPERFTCSHDITAFYLRHHEMNPYIAFFLCTIIMKDKYRWSYGRKPHDVKKFSKSFIKLPVDELGNPDWQFMENYIKALPYGDRLAI